MDFRSHQDINIIHHQLLLQPENVYYTSVSDISDVTINNFLTDIGTTKSITKYLAIESKNSDDLCIFNR